MKKNFKPENELLFLALGGSGEIGMNVNLYGCDGKWLMVDLGMTFGANEYPGIELVFADLEFIEERAKDLLGIVLTHAHEDHIGAVPYFAADLGVPFYPLVDINFPTYTEDEVPADLAAIPVTKPGSRAA